MIPPALVDWLLCGRAVGGGGGGGVGDVVMFVTPYLLSNYFWLSLESFI